MPFYLNKLKTNLLFKLVFISLFAVVVNTFIYFSFGNIYSSAVLNYADFQNQFQSGIYQYRILSGYFLTQIYDMLSTSSVDYQIFKLNFFDPKSEPQMYLALFMLNTFFLVLSAVTMILITESKNFMATNSEKILFTVVAILTIGFSQFVIVPYDVSSYFFVLLFFLFLLRYLQRSSNTDLIILVLIILISTANRESAALSISLAATLLYHRFGRSRKTVMPLLLLVLAFTTVYFGLRLMSTHFSTNDGNLLQQNFTSPKNILGLLFWLVFFLLTIIIAKDRKAAKLIVIFHILSLPYLLMCIYTGILYEIRLYIPVFLTALFLGKIEFTDNQKINLILQKNL